MAKIGPRSIFNRFLIDFGVSGAGGGGRMLRPAAGRRAVRLEFDKNLAGT